jgi:hypothetical protein
MVDLLGLWMVAAGSLRRKSVTTKRGDCIWQVTTTRMIWPIAGVKRVTPNRCFNHCRGRRAGRTLGDYPYA